MFQNKLITILIILVKKVEMFLCHKFVHFFQAYSIQVGSQQCLAKDSNPGYLLTPGKHATNYAIAVRDQLTILELDFQLLLYIFFPNKIVFSP